MIEENEKIINDVRAKQESISKDQKIILKKIGEILKILKILKVKNKIKQVIYKCIAFLKNASILMFLIPILTIIVILITVKTYTTITGELQYYLIGFNVIVFAIILIVLLNERYSQKKAKQLQTKLYNNILKKLYKKRLNAPENHENYKYEKMISELKELFKEH